MHYKAVLRRPVKTYYGSIKYMKQLIIAITLFSCIAPLAYGQVDPQNRCATTPAQKAYAACFQEKIESAEYKALIRQRNAKREELEQLEEIARRSKQRVNLTVDGRTWSYDLVNAASYCAPSTIAVRNVKGCENIPPIVKKLIALAQEYRDLEKKITDKIEEYTKSCTTAQYTEDIADQSAAGCFNRNWTQDSQSSRGAAATDNQQTSWAAVFVNTVANYFNPPATTPAATVSAPQYVPVPAYTTPTTGIPPCRPGSSGPTTGGNNICALPDACNINGYGASINSQACKDALKLMDLSKC